MVALYTSYAFKKSYKILTLNRSSEISMIYIFFGGGEGRHD